MSAQSGLSLGEARADREFWGRLVETAVGAHLANAVAAGECELFYWRERNHELLVGGDGIPVEEFLLQPVKHWVTR